MSTTAIPSASGPVTVVSSTYVVTYDSTTSTGTFVMTTTLPMQLSSTAIDSSNEDNIPHHGDQGPYLQIAGIIVGVVLGVLLLCILFFFLRKGTFGSGVLFGLRYGDARDPDWPGHTFRRSEVRSSSGAAEMVSTQLGGFLFLSYTVSS